MTVARPGLWRPCFLLAGVFILIGGPLHPGGTMEQMLAHPNWVPSHLLQLAGFLALGAGLVLHRRAVPLSEQSTRWSRWALYGTALQAFEMVLHTASSVDHGRLMAGEPTPVLTAHLALAVVAYPLFAAAIVGWILATARDRTLASPWVAWLGIIGVVAHGLAAPLVVAFGLMQFRILFPMVMLLALWLILAALWPRRAAAGAGIAEAATAGT